MLKQSNYRIREDKNKSSNVFEDVTKFQYQKSRKIKYFGVIAINNKAFQQVQYCELIGMNIDIQGRNMMQISLRNVTGIIMKERRIIENKYKTLFIRSFNHEIRHPATNISTLLDNTINIINSYSINNNLDISPISQKLQLLELEVSYLLNLSKQITDIIEIQSSTFQLKPQEFNLKEFSKECFDYIRESANRKGLQLKTEIYIEEKEQNIVADKQRIKQLIQNLLANALKYTKFGFIGIIISYSKQELESSGEYDQINQLIQQKKKLLKFQVVDTGIGINKEAQQQLFILFGSTNQQLLNIERSQCGIGLGLFVSQQLAQQLGKKDIKVKTGEHGTTFAFYVGASTQKNALFTIPSFYTEEILLQASPNAFAFQKSYEQGGSIQIRRKQLKKQDMQQQDLILKKQKSIQTQKQKSIQTQKEKNSKQCNCIQILIVDDTEMICQLLTEVLQKFRTCEVKDGEEAVKAVRRQMLNECCQKFQLITMDCQMPIMDGWTATKIIRKMGYAGPILGHTAYTGQQDIQRCLKAGMNQVIAKPSKVQDILDMVEGLRDVNTISIPILSPSTMSRTRTFSRYLQSKMMHNFSPQCRLMIRKQSRNKTEHQVHDRNLCPQCALLINTQNSIE